MVLSSKPVWAIQQDPFLKKKKGQVKSSRPASTNRLMPVILATQEAEIRRSMV
jgi:hypothetical protein